MRKVSIRLSRTAVKAAAGFVALPEKAKLSRPNKHGLIMDSTTTKVTTFCTALLPQIVQLEAFNLNPHLGTRGAFFMLATRLAFGAIARMSESLRTWMAKTPNARVCSNRLCGTVFGLLAICLVVAEQ